MDTPIYKALQDNDVHYGYAVVTSTDSRNGKREAVYANIPANVHPQVLLVLFEDREFDVEYSYMESDTWQARSSKELRTHITLVMLHPGTDHQIPARS